MEHYWYITVGKSVRIVGVGRKPFEFIEMPCFPKGISVFTGEHDYTPVPLKKRRYTVKCVCAPDKESAVAFVKSQWFNGGGK